MNSHSLRLAAASFAAWSDDRMGAILVKEARQAVRSRFVVAIQFLFLAVLLGALGVAILFDMDGSGTASRTLGAGLFMAIHVILHIVVVFCVPLYVGVRMAAERSDTNVDLLFSTTIKPWSVVAGKLASGMLLGLLAMSACAPFMVLCYFLRGVDIGTIAFTLASEAQLLVVATMAALFISTLPLGMVLKGLAAVGYLILGCMSFGFVLTSLRGFGPPVPPLGTQLAIFFLQAGVCGLLFVLVAAMLSPPSSNRAFPVRLYLTLAWLVSAGVSLWLDFALHSSSFEPTKLWAVVWSVLLAVATMVAGSERDRLGPRMKAQIATVGGKVNVTSLLLYSGAAGGLLWTAGMIAATVGTCVVLSYTLGFLFSGTPRDVGDLLDLALRIAVANGMTLGYVLLAGCIRRRLWPNGPTHANGFFLVAIVTVAAVGPLVWRVMAKGSANNLEEACIGFPFSCVVLDGVGPVHYREVLHFSAMWAIVLLTGGLVWAAPWIWAQLKAFKAARTAGSEDVQ